MASFPIFGTGGLWKAASGSGTPSDPFVPAVNVTSGGSGFPLTADADFAGYAALNANIIQYQGATLTHASSPVGTPLTLTAGALALVDTSGGTVEAKLPAAVLGASIYVFDAAATWDSNTFKLSPNGAENINGANASVICNWRDGFGGAYCFDGTNWQTFGQLFLPTNRTVTNADGAVILSDCGPPGFGGLINMNCASGQNLVLPANGTIAVPIGYEVYCYNQGAGQITWTITSDTIHGSGGKVASSGQYALTGARKVAATTWVIFGDRA